MVWFKLNVHKLSQSEYNKWISLASPEKQQRITRFCHEGDKKRSVAGEMLAKKSIAETLNIAPEEIIIKVTSQGKPYVEDRPIHFNISHCEDYVVCAVNEKEIGIDIEKIRDVNLSIAERFFTHSEREYLNNGDTADKNKRFFEIWTAKEAYLKWLGSGITDELSKLDVPQANVKRFYFEDYVVAVYTEE
ncbi:MAG: 4'-phosphopantetheinyl transferase superfamily protein [Clostridia bacterium]|nr:4'-phosphopantetheinyl transferase superfamily protein [Clostridia bacterium]